MSQRRKDNSMVRLKCCRNNIFYWGGVFAFVPAFFFLTGPVKAGQAPKTPLVFAGSGTNLPIVRVLAKAFQRSHPGIEIDVPESIGSTGGIQAVAYGAIALGLISRELKDKEKGKGLTVLTYARTPMIIGVHPSVPEDNITYEELLNIYRGKKRTWRDGNDIVVLTREPGDSSIEVLVRGIPGFREAYDESLKAKRWTVLLSDLKMNETLAKTPDAVGLSDLGLITIEKHAIKPLKVNGTAPTLKSLQGGNYTLYKTLSFVYRKDTLTAGAREFMAFVKSGQGKKILTDNGYLQELK